MVSEDIAGRAMQLPSGPLCSLVPGAAEPAQDREAVAHEANDQEEEPVGSFQRSGIGDFHGCAATDAADATQDGHSCHPFDGRGGGTQGGPASQEAIERDRRFQHGVGRCQKVEAPVTETPAASEGVGIKHVSTLARRITQESDAMIPQAFQGLVTKGKTVLVEVACSPESRLSAEVQRQMGYESSALRCSHWNGCDLGNGAGVKHVIEIIEKNRPDHVWISTECGPYSPMQAVNQRSEKQAQELAEKRREALKQYVGASCIYHHCIQQGIHVTWEWSEKCQAWRLPLIQKMMKRYEPYICVTHGCQVNLRNPKTHTLMHKGWKLMTTHQRLSELMQLPCRCPKGFVHAKCEGGLASMSAYYTPEYVKRVCCALLQELTLPQLRREMEGRSSLPRSFGEGQCCVCEDLKVHEAKVTCGACTVTDIPHTHMTPDHVTHGSPSPLPSSLHEPHGPACPAIPLSQHVFMTASGEFTTGQTQGHSSKQEYPGDEVTGAKHGGEQGNEDAMALQHWREEKNLEEINRKLYLLHAATGHSSVRNMIQALQRRGASKAVMDQARNFRCSVCEEKQKVNFKHAASLEPLPPKLATISADGGKWEHPQSKEEYEFAVIIDEGSRFRVARVMKVGKKQTMNAAMFLSYLREGWIQYFGKPNVLRLDPAGAFRSHSVESFCDENEMYLDIIPGEAHWQLGTCEQAVKGLKELMTKLVEHEPTMSAEAALAEAVRTFNHRELVRGFSPVQHLLGKAPDETGRFVSSLTGAQFETLLENPSDSMRTSIERMKIAEQALSEWQAKQRLTRAINSRAQKIMTYRPGDLVYFWRKQVKAAGKNGAYLGPARVLATETKKTASGGLRPGSAIWCVRGRRLLKCSPEQLRPASPREELLDHLAAEEDEAEAPWTFPRIAEELGGNEYEDISEEIPDAEMKQAAQEEPLPRRALYRHSVKRPSSWPRDEQRRPEPRARTSQPSDANAAHEVQTEQAWWASLEDSAFAAEGETTFWSSPTAMFQIEIDMPDSRRGAQKAFEDLGAYFVGAMKRRATEVSEKRLSPEDFQKFQEAKQKEVKNFVAAQAFEAIPGHLRPTRDQAIGMRWLLSWKIQDDGTPKAKARAILQGYQDPQYEYRATTTPVMTRQTRQCLLQMAAHRRWELFKGDVTGAFLQGRSYPTELYCVPCPEISRAMGLTEGDIVRVKKGCYGLVDAPLEWYKTIAAFLEEIGLVKTWSDPCCWAWKPKGKLRGLIAGHVDDFLFAGGKEDKEWQAIKQKIQERFKWSDWETGKFVQCGVTIEAKPDGSFELSQPTYLDKVSEINLCSSRRKDSKSPTTEWEKSSLRAVLGALSWRAQQVAPHYSAEVGLLLSEVTDSSVDTVLRTNKLLAAARGRKTHKLVVHAFTPDTKLGVFTWADASGQNRRDGSSTQGIFVGVAPLSMLEGCLEKVTPIAWHAGKIDRIARSPGAAEAIAVINGEDLMYHVRYQLGEYLEESPNIFDVDRTVNLIDGCLISDSRNVFDKLQTDELSVKGAERRTDLELLSLKSAQKHNHVKLRWVHSQAQLGNALTKAGAKELELFYQTGMQWRIVSDDQMRSARKRQQQGIPTLEHSKTNPQDPAQELSHKRDR